MGKKKYYREGGNIAEFANMSEIFDQKTFGKFSIFFKNSEKHFFDLFMD
jgi:hypothetical protein